MASPLAGFSLLIVALSMVSAFPDQETITIDCDTPWVLHNASSEAGGLTPALSLALRDVRKDWRQRLGIEPLVLGTYFPYTDWIDQGPRKELPPPLPRPNPSSDAGTFVYFGTVASLPLPDEDLRLISSALGQQPEAHGCFFLPPSSYRTLSVLACTGLDSLGSVFAVYELSSAILGIGPQDFWTENEKSTRVSNVSVTLATVSTGLYRVGRPASAPTAPHYRYRGFFVNDEDMLGEFAKDPLGQSVFSVEMWDKVLMTVLRLKGNLIILGTAAYPDELSFELADRRGLHIAEHHITLLGTNCFQWPKGVPYSFAKSRETQLQVWRQLVQAQSSRRMLWTVGYRGLNDYPFWHDDTSFTTDAERGALISEAMETQMEVIRNVSGDDHPEAFTYLWSEMTGLYTGGHLKIPEGVTVVHADAGNGYVDPLSLSLVTPGHGLYLHIQVEGGKQLTEVVPPMRLFQTLDDMTKRNATKIVVLNLSDLRPVPLTTRAVMNYLYDPSDPTLASQDIFLSHWIASEFGDESVSHLLPVFSQYFSMPYIQNETLSTHLGEGDLVAKARSLASELTLSLTQHHDLPIADAEKAASLSLGRDYLVQLYQQATAALPSVPPSRRAFYTSHLLTQTDMWLQTATALDALSSAVFAAHGGDKRALQQHAMAALQAAETVLATEYEGETGRWVGWYLAEWLDGYVNLRDVCRGLVAATQGEPSPRSRPFRFGTGSWNSWFQYERTPEHVDGDAHFPFFYARGGGDGMHNAVRFRCGSNTCNDTVIGGTFAGHATVHLSPISPTEGSCVRYTVCGEGDYTCVPTASSTKYQDPLQLSATTIIAAASFDATTHQPLPPVTRALFNMTSQS